MKLLIPLLVATTLATSAAAAVGASKAIAIAKHECAPIVKAIQRDRSAKLLEWRVTRHGSVWYVTWSAGPDHNWCGRLNVQVDVATGAALHPGAPGNMETCYGCVE